MYQLCNFSHNSSQDIPTALADKNSSEQCNIERALDLESKVQSYYVSCNCGS